MNVVLKLKRVRTAHKIPILLFGAVNWWATYTMSTDRLWKKISIKWYHYKASKYYIRRARTLVLLIIITCKSHEVTTLNKNVIQDYVSLKNVVITKTDSVVSKPWKQHMWKMTFFLHAGEHLLQFLGHGLRGLTKKPGHLACLHTIHEPSQDTELQVHLMSSAARVSTVHMHILEREEEVPVKTRRKAELQRRDVLK